MEERVGKLEEEEVVVVGQTVKEDSQVERSGTCELVQHGSKENPEDVLDEAAHLNQLQPSPPPSPPQLSNFISNGISEVHLGNRKKPVFDAVVENQEALQLILTNQETLKDLMAKLLKTVSVVEERLQTMGREIGALSSFTQELNQVGDDNNWA